MSFALILVILSLITGLVSLIDRYWLSKRRPQGQPTPKWIEQIKSFFPVFITVLLLRSFLIEPFRIPSGSLEPSLLVGDFVAVNKFAYGFKLPVIEKKIIPVSLPKTGEISVFRWPPNPTYDYIKRVIGVPGDHIIYKNKILTINNKEIPRTFQEFTTDESSGKPVEQYIENLQGIKHPIFIRPDIQGVDFDITVPKGQYFMMGDNRDDSADSRFWGFVEEKYLRGKAFLIWMSWNNHSDMVRWNRIGKVIY